MNREELYESIDKQIIAEKVYRKKIKDAISKFNSKRLDEQKKNMIVEKIYRAKIRKDLNSLLEKKDTVRYKSTGLNSLDDLFMNSNFLTTLETPYYTLTTSKEQRDDYKNHVLQAILDFFKTLSPEQEPEMVNESLQYIFEQEEADISVEVTDEELPDDKVVGPERRDRDEAQEKLEKELESDNAKSIKTSGDFTGRNKARSAVSKVEKSIKDYYDDLGNPADAADFKTYLIANLRLYFDSWENALQNDADPQFSQDVNKAVEDAQADIEAGEVSDAATAEEPATEEGGDDMTDLELDLDI
ncbi:MAG: hypothetical protein GOVbin703_26 [Prokaryotic dsDNA virus sp.]|nr:MAG: hypothetical protein GOVbin703_26 [Prokaryotic dsDNA virus sp.]|tara:strand:- start:7197 stop:8099 length:903 start_codon:yes stop_codon:yes gene_type:complete